jgi:hypothetical protein
VTVETPSRRSYSEEDVAASLTALRANDGVVKRTAEDLGIPRMTLAQWAMETRRPQTAGNAAQRLQVSQDKSQETIRMLDAIIPQALARVAEALPSVNGYQAMLVSAIAIDKRQLLSGGPTSRTETLRARYVEPASLRSLSSGVIDVEASPQRVRGVEDGAGPSHLPEKQKRPRAKRKTTARTSNSAPGTP